MDEKSSTVYSVHQSPVATTSDLDNQSNCKTTSVRVATGLNFDDEAGSTQRERQRIEKRLVRKLDLCLLPVLILMCLFQAIDKSLIGYVPIQFLNRPIYDTSSTSSCQDQFSH